MTGMQLSPHGERDVMSQRVTKGLMGSVAASQGADVNVSEDAVRHSAEMEVFSGPGWAIRQEQTPVFVMTPAITHRFLVRLGRPL